MTETKKPETYKISDYEIQTGIINQPEEAIKRIFQRLELSQTNQAIMLASAENFEAYLRSYLTDPIAQIRIENEAIPGLVKKMLGGRAPLSEEAQRRFVTEKAIELHAQIEQFALPESANPNAKTYEELFNAGFLCNGDYTPGRNFRLGKSCAENVNREKMILHKTSEKVLPMLVAAKMQQGPRNRDLVEKLSETIAKRIPYLGGTHEKEAEMSLGRFVDGGVCRHMAALLQLCLQEAGFRSVYVQGNFQKRAHAWTEVDLGEEGDYSLIADPAQKEVLSKTEALPEEPDVPLYSIFYSIEDRVNKVWRPRKT